MKNVISDGNIIKSFIENARKNPGRAAIVYHEKKSGYGAISYGTLLEEVENMAGRMLRRGIVKGDRVVVFIPMSPDLYRTVLALFYIGAVAVFIDAWANIDRINQACEIANPRCFIGTPRAHLIRFLSRLRKLPVSIMEPPLFRLGRRGSGKHKPAHPVEAKDDEDALITFTTGSTGRPKAARRTHGFLRLQHQALSRSLSLSDDDVDLTTLPIFLLNNLALGITSVIPRSSSARHGLFDPPLIIDQIRRFDITSTAGSPAFYEGLAEYIIRTGERVDLKKLFVGGAPVYSANARLFRDAFPGTDITAVYGSTEAEPISKIPIESVLNADVMEGLPVGKIVRGLEVRIIRPVDGPVEPGGKKGLREFLLGKGEIGEIILHGPHVLKEYLNSPEDFRLNKIIDGKRIWHRTGDAGSLGPGGELHFYGRVKNRIIGGKGVLYTLPLEIMLRGIDGISAAAIIETGDGLTAFLETGKGTARGKESYAVNVAGRLLRAYGSFNVRLIEGLPRDPRHNSKIDYDKLKNILG